MNQSSDPLIIPENQTLTKKKKNDYHLKKSLNSYINLTWKNISYSIKSKKILDDITGYAKHSELTAIMGSSGAGKTSLLNCLSCRINSGLFSKVTGSIYANEFKLNEEIFGNIAAFVMQDDILMDTLTPYETLTFAANLKLKEDFGERKKKVDELIQSLKLEKCKNTRIGNHLEKGISGGEKRRVSIGVELIAEPSLLFLDEPTSGLDSFTSLVIIALLKEQAKLGRTIIFTIHQPSSDIFKLFDKLILMSEGKIIYQGKSENSISYFNDIGYSCPLYSNPADFFMNIVYTETPKTEKDVQKLDLFHSNYHQKNVLSILEEMDEFSKTNNTIIHSAKPSFYRAFIEISKRTFKNFIRNKTLFINRLFVKIFTAILTCLLYYKSDNVYNLEGGLFFICINMFLVSIAGLVLTFPAERSLFLKEYSSRMYGVGSYFLGRTLIETPFFLIAPTIFSLIVYWICTFNNSDPSKFFIFLLINIGVFLIGVSFGLLIGSLASDPKVAMGLTPMAVTPMMIFAGFVVNINSLPKWLSWLAYISPFRYALEAYFRNEFGGTQNLESIVTQYGFNYGLWPCIGALFGFMIFWRLVAFVVLWLFIKKLN